MISNLIVVAALAAGPHPDESISHVHITGIGTRSNADEGPMRVQFSALPPSCKNPDNWIRLTRNFNRSLPDLISAIYLKGQQVKFVTERIGDECVGLTSLETVLPKQ